jgi:hypothetical protein
MPVLQMTLFQMANMLIHKMIECKMLIDQMIKNKMYGDKMTLYKMTIRKHCRPNVDGEDVCRGNDIALFHLWRQDLDVLSTHTGEQLPVRSSVPAVSRNRHRLNFLN